MPKTLNPQDIADFRERLCDVAERLFAEKGPEAVTVRELATELGVSAMTPYRYFADKDAMLAAVRARAFDRFADAMEQAFADSEAPTEAGRAYVDFAFDHPAAYRLMFDVNQPTFAQYPDLGRAMDRAKATMSIAARFLAGQGRLPHAEVEMFSHVVWAAMHGPIMLQLAGLLPADLDARAIIASAAPALLQGLVNPALGTPD